MAIVVVGGSSRGAGKTALVCGLIAALPELRWTAVKITTHDHGQLKPIWEETSAGQGTDTARYLAAGAAQALLATPPVHEHMPDEPPSPDFPTLLDELWPRFGRGANLIFESNSILRHLRPDLCLMVHGGSEHGSRKPSFSAAVRHADAMVAHSEADAVTPDGLCGAGHEPKPIFHLAALERVSPEMLTWVRERLNGRGPLKMD